MRLLDYAVEQEFGVKCGERRFGKYGKPYFENSDIFFNYSHCGYGVACVVAKEEVGIDIEHIKTVRPAVIERVCCENELLLIGKKTDKVGKTVYDCENFKRIWVMKEAYAKFTGKGFAERLESIDTTKLPKKCSFKVDNCYIGFYCESINEVTPELVQFTINN